MRRRYRRPRRHRFGRHREPQLFVVTDEPYAGEVIAAFTRGIFRYRSELAPFITAAFLAGAGLWLHDAHPGWWSTVLLGAVALAVLVLLRGHRRLDRVEERLYAAAVILAAGGWLAAATVHGPLRLRAPLLALTTAAGIPWWWHRRRRARVRIERTIQAWPDLADTIGLTGSRLVSSVVDLWGWRARLALKHGQTVADVLGKVQAIESGLGTRPGSVRVEPNPADRCTLHVLETDPHARPIPWPRPTGTTITDPVELGLFEDATPVQVPLAHRHVLVGGIAGSGKSGVLNAILASLTACPDVVLWGIDLKGGMELQPWAACLDRLATNPSQAAALLADADAILDARATDQAGKGNRLWQPSPDAPALVIVIDEYAELADQAPDAVQHTDSIARRGRAVSVTLLAATQRPTQAAMGKGAVRSQMDVRICLRVRERRDIDLVLGQGAFTTGWHAHTLDAPGKFLISAPGFDIPRRARAYLLTDERVRATVRDHTKRRPHLDALSAAAIHAPVDEVPDLSENTGQGPEAALLDALRAAPPEGLPVPILIKTSGMRRTWIYERLQQYTTDGTVTQVSRGRWRATVSDQEQ